MENKNLNQNINQNQFRSKNNYCSRSYCTRALCFVFIALMLFLSGFTANSTYDNSTYDNSAKPNGTQPGFTADILEVRTLREEFINVCGWLNIPGTSIKEPIVKGTDNVHYLRHNYKNKRASAGAVFMDFRNKGQFYDTHTALYGHYMDSGTLFHDLHYYKKSDFLRDNPSISITGVREKREYKIISVQIVNADDYYLVLDLKDEALEAYIHYLNRASMHPIALPDISAKSIYCDLKLLTLVTCSYELDNARLLIHAIEGR